MAISKVLILKASYELLKLVILLIVLLIKKKIKILIIINVYKIP